ncbi:MAG TPA: family 43 glycosylhydrolase, partial [Polyangiaceae bacterium]
MTGALPRRMKIFMMAAVAGLAMACGGEGDGSSDDALVKNVTGYAGAYKSPSIVRDGGTYHAYFAKSQIGGKTFNVPHATFDASDKWTSPHEALPKLGKDADANGDVWAPAAAQIGPNRWMLYYTATLANHGDKKCIWRAHATSGAGPFVDDYDGPLVCPDQSEWALDAYVVRDMHDRWILGMRYDLGNGINSIQIRELNATATH